MYPHTVSSYGLEQSRPTSARNNSSSARGENELTAAKAQSSSSDPYAVGAFLTLSRSPSENSHTSAMSLLFFAGLLPATTRRSHRVAHRVDAPLAQTPSPSPFQYYGWRSNQSGFPIVRNAFSPIHWRPVFLGYLYAHRGASHRNLRGSFGHPLHGPTLGSSRSNGGVFHDT